MVKPVLLRKLGIAGADFPSQLTGMMNSVHYAQSKTESCSHQKSAGKPRPITRSGEKVFVTIFVTDALNTCK